MTLDERSQDVRAIIPAMSTEAPPPPACPLGHAAPLVPAIPETTDQFFGVDGTFSYSMCPTCQTLVLSPRPAPHELGRYYAPYYPESLLSQLRAKAAAGLPPRGPARLRAIGFLRQLTSIAGRPPPGTRLLDVGCGLGQFPRWVRQLAGLDVRGLDFDPVCKTFAAEVHGVEVDTGELRQQRYPDGAFDIVTAWHVMEHVYDPQTELHEMARVLKPGGYMMVETPTPSIWMRIFRRRWLYLQAPTHLYHYAPETLAELMRRAGLEVQLIKRPWFPGELAGSLFLTLGLNGFVPKLFRPGRTTWQRVLTWLFLMQMIYDLPVSILLALLGKGGIVRIFARKPGPPAWPPQA
ncbi:MAG: class I SAM-dependent methyltransferase [Myxococcota bacterium]